MTIIIFFKKKNMPDIYFFLFLIAAYLLGGIPNGKWISKMRGVDIFAVGSKTMGATNVNRKLGFRWAAVVAVLDIAKSFFPTLLAAIIYKQDWMICTIAIAVSLGHVFSPYIGFRGGKAVSTYIGSLLVINPVLTLLWLPIWAIAVKLINIMSLINIIMLFVFVPLLTFFMGNVFGIYAFFMWALITWAHRANIRRLISGEELKIRTRGGKNG
jgi:acyl phosphate:glycerol-3-phosphate acyltransferase